MSIEHGNNRLTRTGRVRRGLVKSIFIGIPAALLAGNEVNKELPGRVEGILRLKEATIYPIYDIHETGITPEQIPNGLDAVLREGGFSVKQVKDAVSSAYLTRVKGDGNKTRALQEAPIDVFDNLFLSNALSTYPSRQEYLPSNVLQVLVDRKMKLLMGDLNTDPLKDNFLPQLFYEGTIGLAATLQRLETMLGERKEKKTTNTRVLDTNKRRTLFKNIWHGAVNTLAFWGLSESLEGLNYVAYAQGNPWVRRIITRLSDIDQIIHPERTHELLRNAFLANSIFTGAQLIQQEITSKGENRIPSIGLWTHASHNGIEDFLQAGSWFTNFFIAANAWVNPNLMRSYIADSGNNIDDFCSMLALDFNKNPLLPADAPVASINVKFRKNSPLRDLLTSTLHWDAKAA